MNLRENIKKELRSLNEQVTICDWANYPTWVSTWTNNSAFQNVNNNPNQPCNHICGRLQLWNANLITAGIVQWEQLRCKILEGENQAIIHGCPC